MEDGKLCLAFRIIDIPPRQHLHGNGTLELEVGRAFLLVVGTLKADISHYGAPDKAKHVFKCVVVIADQLQEVQFIGQILRRDRPLARVIQRYKHLQAHL